MAVMSIPTTSACWVRKKSTPRPARSMRSRSSACATRRKPSAPLSCGSPRTGITCWSVCNRLKPTARSTTSCSWTVRSMARLSKAADPARNEKPRNCGAFFCLMISRGVMQLNKKKITCGEGACSRWAAKRPQKSGTAAQSNGSKLPRHKSSLPQSSVLRSTDGLNRKPRHHGVQVHRQPRQLLTRRTGLVRPGRGLQRQVTDIHQVAIHFPRHSRLLLRGTGDHDVALVDQGERRGNLLQRNARCFRYFQGRARPTIALLHRADG